MCMIPTSDAGFSPVASTSASVSTASANEALPGASFTKVHVTNIGNANLFVALGDNTVSASIGTSLVIVPNSSIVLAVGTATYIAFIADNSFDGIYITTGN